MFFSPVANAPSIRARPGRCNLLYSFPTPLLKACLVYCAPRRKVIALICMWLFVGQRVNVKYKNPLLRAIVKCTPRLGTWEIKRHCTPLRLFLVDCVLDDIIALSSNLHRSRDDFVELRRPSLLSRGQAKDGPGYTSFKSVNVKIRSKQKGGLIPTALC